MTGLQAENGRPGEQYDHLTGKLIGLAMKVHYDGVVVGDFVADLRVEKALLVELKAILALATAHEVQLAHDLTATNIEEGLLLNFGAPRLEFRTYRPPAPHSGHFVHSVPPPPA